MLVNKSCLNLIFSKLFISLNDSDRIITTLGLFQELLFLYIVFSIKAIASSLE